jgi:hypothetical protein
MSEQPAKQTTEQIEDLIRDALQSWPLYRELRYQGGSSARVPTLLVLFCDLCGNQEIWETTFHQFEENTTGFGVKEYKCRNCAGRVARFYFYWARQDDGRYLFFKAGQYPELEERVSLPLQKELGKDLKLYKNAIRLRNFNLGIGAVAYLRRIIENHMNDLLDTIFEAAQLANMSSETLKSLEQVKAGRGFQDKIEFAESLLPPRLRPEGVARPFAVLYELTSIGLHARSEEDCIAVFDGCRRIFEYVFSQVHLENEAARQFKTDLANAPKLGPSKT